MPALTAAQGMLRTRGASRCAAPYDLPDPARVDYDLIDVIGVFENHFESTSTPVRVG